MSATQPRGVHDKPAPIITNDKDKDKDKDKNLEKAKAKAKSGLYSYAQSSLNRVVSPSSRQRAYDSASAFATNRPILFSFAAFQLLFSFLPLLLFASFAISTIAFALAAAVLFALFWVGLALLLLVPALFLTFSVAVFFWGWAVGSFLVARWLYNHAPVILNGPVVEKRHNGAAHEKKQHD